MPPLRPLYAERVRLKLTILSAALVGLLASPALAETWAGPVDAVGAWRVADLATAGSFFDQPDSMVVGSNVTRFESFAAFEATQSISTKLVMYDIESWRRTPQIEQQYPKRYMRRFVLLAHQRGLVAILAPARNIVAPSLGCNGRLGETLTEAFIRCGLAGVPADYLLLQSQRLECDLGSFTWFVQQARTQVQGRLLVELTVAWNSPCVTPDAVVNAWNAARPYADGFALWGVGGVRADIAIAALTTINAMRMA